MAEEKTAKKKGNTQAKGRPPTPPKTYESKRFYRRILAEKDLTTKKVSELTGRTGQSISNRIARDSYTFSEFVTLAKELGYTVVLRDDKTGKIIE